MEALIKITSKGQVTIPKKISRPFRNKYSAFSNGRRKNCTWPVRDVGGIFKKYVKKSLPYEKEREVAWQKVADKYCNLP